MGSRESTPGVVYGVFKRQESGDTLPLAALAWLGVAWFGTAVGAEDG